MSVWVEEGQMAPDFTLESDGGERVTLSELRGRPIVVYFYPRDDTSGCTKEACAFRDRSEELRREGAALVGISPDSLESHRAFRDKHDLNFPLLADEDHEVAEAYGAWREKNLYGKRTTGIQRSTFLVDEQGKVAKVWRRVRVEGHDDEVLEALRALAE